MSVSTISNDDQLALFESVINSSDDAIITKTLGGTITSWNSAAETLFGFSREEIIGANISILIPEERISEELEIIKKIKAGEKVKHYETERIRKDGSRIYISLTVSPLKDKSGVIIGASKIARDITLQKKTNDSLKQSLREIADYRYALDESSIVAITDTKGTIQFVNDNFCAISKYSREELIGRDHRIVSSGYHNESFIRDLWVTIGSGKVWKGEIKNKAKDGSLYWVDTTIVPFLDEHSKPYQYVAIRKDITDRKNEDLQKTFLAEAGMVFNENTSLTESLRKVLKKLLEFSDFSVAEVWLIGAAKRRITLFAKAFLEEGMNIFYEESAAIKSFEKGEGLPGFTWERQRIQYWQHIDEKDIFLRRSAAKSAGLKSAYGLPLRYNNEIIGVLVLALNTHEKPGISFDRVLENISIQLGVEIKRKQLEQELKQIFNFAPDIVCVAGMDGYFKKVNPAMCKLLEYTEQELLTTPIVNFIHIDDRERSAQELTEKSEGNITFDFENRCVTKSGQIKWLAWTSTPVTEERLVFCVAKDITDKKNLEDLLDKATTLARIGAFEVDLVHKTTTWSAMSREIFELGEDYPIGFEIGYDFFDKEYIALIREKREKIIETSIPFDIEVTITTATGNKKWIRIICEAEFRDSECVRLYGSFQDIDARKKAEIAGKMALEERNTILESIDDAFFAVDKNWVVTYWNSRAEKVLRKTKSEVLDHNLWTVFAGSVDSESYRQYHRAMDTGQMAQFEDYYPPLHKWYEISAYPSDSGLSVYFKDVTDRKTAELQLKELNDNLSKQAKELKISNTELEQFAYVASHDLQEPLRMVTSFLSQLEKNYSDVIDDRGKKYIYFAVDGAKRMRQIILDLLEFSRVGRTDDNIEEVHIGKLIDDILVLLRKKVKDKHAVVSYGNLPTLHTYKSPMRQVFQNLISNSLKYHQQGIDPIIDICCEETEQYWKFSVKDNGIGIDAEYFDKIFIIFQRLHNKDEYSGTGMGLAVTKKIVENMGGSIWVESEEGKGSTFHFTILKSRL